MSVPATLTGIWPFLSRSASEPADPARLPGRGWAARGQGVLWVMTGLLLLALGAGVVTMLRGSSGGPAQVPATVSWPDDRVQPAAAEAGALRGLHGRAGYGASAEGGLRGPVRWVTNLSDSGSGSLRAVLAQSGPAWVRFTPGLRGHLVLGSPVSVPSRTTVDGRGAEIRISGHGLVMSGSQDVVIAFLVFDATRPWQEHLGNAAVLAWKGASNIWIHKSTFVGAGPGTGGVGVLIMDHAFSVTVSWSRFSRWDKSVLVGGDPIDPAAAGDRVTLHHNFFDRTHQRNPLVRFGRVHTYSNWLRHWGAPGAGVGMQVTSGGELLSEGDVFDGRYERPALQSGEYGAEDIPLGFLRQSGSAFYDISSYLIEEHAPNLVFDPPYRRSVVPPDDQLRRALDAGAGWHWTEEE